MGTAIETFQDPEQIRLSEYQAGKTVMSDNNHENYAGAGQYLRIGLCLPNGPLDYQ